MKKEKIWVDNNIFNYLCKADCFKHILKISYDICTTELVQREAEQGGAILQEAITAMQEGSIYVHPISAPPLEGAIPKLSAVDRTDRSLATCAQQLDGKVLTHDKSLQKYCQREQIACWRFEDFLSEAERQGWLSTEQVSNLRKLAGI